MNGRAEAMVDLDTYGPGGETSAVPCGSFRTNAGAVGPGYRGENIAQPLDIGMLQEDPLKPLPRSGVGSFALVFGLVAVVFAFVPIVGEFVAAPAALLAIVLGLVGLWRVDRGIADNGRHALTGSFLGVLSGLIMFLIFAATVGPVN